MLNAGHDKWPLSLDNPALIRAIGNGDTAIIASTRLHGVSINLDGSVTYTLPPNTYANRVGAIVTANDWVNPTDGTLPVLIASFAFADGRHWGTGTFSDVMLDDGKALNLIYQVRNWSNQVAPTRPDFVAPPLDPSVFQLFAGPGTSGPDSVFSDLQTFNIPDTLRSTAISTVRFSSYSFITSTTGLLSGLVVWPSFEIRNRQGGGLGLQTQFKLAYAGLSYGGYIVGDTLYGARNNIGELGCLLSCMAMVNSYFGDSITVADLDKYLALKHGFSVLRLVTIASVNGQDPGATVTWNVNTGINLMVNDTVLVETTGGRPLPLVTLVTGPTTNQGTISSRHRGGTIATGMQGVAYTEVRTGVASSYSQTGHPWEIRPIGGNPLTVPGAVETALADSLPVVLEEPNHFLLARGWRPSIGSNFANGTYVINDPGHTGVTRLNQIFLDVHSIPRSYSNVFSAARICTRTSGNQYRVTTSASNALDFVLQGNGRLSLVDPNGHSLYYDNLVGGYVGDMPNADAWPGYGAGLDNDPSAADAPVEFVEVAGGADGDYQAVITGGSTGTVGLGVLTIDPAGPGAGDYVEYPVIAGHSVAFAAHVVQGAAPAVQIDTLGVAAVDDRGATDHADLFVWPNPSSSKVELSAQIARPGRLVIDVFDVAGRLVARPFEGSVIAGEHSFSWDPHQGRTMALGSGLFFVRMRLASLVITRRVVVMQ
ncbi:MAG: hypothetical protein ACRENS_06965 [Candidatus Eiseniibacteriota bacterium]